MCQAKTYSDNQKCRKCDEVKSLNQFYMRRDGKRESQCAQCRREMARKRSGAVHNSAGQKRGGHEAHLSYEINDRWNLFTSYQVMSRSMSCLGQQTQSH